MNNKGNEIPSFQGEDNVFTKRYKEVYQLQQQQLWTKNNIKNMSGDVVDHERLSDELTTLFEELFLAFTSYDIGVGMSYNTVKEYVHHDETHAHNMLDCFIYCETVHNTSYSLLTETLGFKNEFYKRFKEVPELSDKIKTLLTSRPTPSEKPLEEMTDMELQEHYEEICEFIFVMSGLVEGVVLMSLFSILLMFSVNGSFQAMATINKWSIRDEDLHILGNSVLFEEFTTKMPYGYRSGFKDRLRMLASTFKTEEMRMINFLLRNSETKEIKIDVDMSITPESHKRYLDWLVNDKLALFKVTEYTPTPLPEGYEFLETMLGSSSVVDFFSNDVNDYLTGSVTGTLSDVLKLLQEKYGEK